MSKTAITTRVRKTDRGASIIDIGGEVNGFAEEALSAAYEDASANGVRAILLNFEDLEYMNSSGIGLLVTILIRAQRNRQRLMACGLNEHYQQIFALTRLNEAIVIFPGEAEALAAV